MARSLSGARNVRLQSDELTRMCSVLSSCNFGRLFCGGACPARRMESRTNHATGPPRPEQTNVGPKESPPENRVRVIWLFQSSTKLRHPIAALRGNLRQHRNAHRKTKPAPMFGPMLQANLAFAKGWARNRCA